MNWISVEQGLPEKEVDVLVWFEVGMSHFDIANYDGDSDWNSSNQGHVYDAWPRFWMPLPADPVSALSSSGSGPKNPDETAA